MNEEMQPLERLCAGPSCPVALANGRVPGRSGYYAIYLDDLGAFPEIFRSELSSRGTELVYVGIATVSLSERLLEQDLRHVRPSTFFRGIGSILGYRPPPGSLIGRSNQNNYKFNASDTSEIIRWIGKNLSVSWLEASPALATIETELIRAQRPLLNTTHNPAPLSALAALRLECRTIARSR